MKEQAMQSIIDLLEKLNYFELIADSDKYEQFIQNLTVEQFKNLIVTFNAKLRGIQSSHKGTIDHDFMTVGTAVSPSKDIRDSILKKLLDAIKKTHIDKTRATLTYYVLLSLHMFEEANGRTARLFYDLIMGDTNFKENINWYVHNENDRRETESIFEYNRGLEDIDKICLLSGYKLFEEMKEEGLSVDERIERKAIQVYGKEIIIPNGIKEQLTDYEIKNIHFLLKDNDGEYTIGGLTMLVMAIKKGQLEEWITANEESTRMVQEKYPHSRDAMQRSQRFVFALERKRELFNSWTVDDYKDLINVGNGIKEKKITCTINMFLESESYIPEDEKKQAIVV